MNDGRREKKRIKVQGSRAPHSGDRAERADAGASDLSVADAVDVAFDEIMAEVAPSRRRPKPVVSQPAPDEASPQAEAEAPFTDDLAAALAARNDYLAQMQRLQAEFDNYRKRVLRDNEAMVLRAGEGVVESLLPVSDNMERALEAAGRHEPEQVVEGVHLVAGQLRAVLESHGLEDVPAEPGLPFDPTLHEAVLVQAHDDLPEGSIVRVLERGYLLHGRLLRPAKVIVSQ